MTPPKYTPDLPRVSQIVESVYPFIGNAKERFEDWLMANDIWVEEYMQEASEGGTYVHTAMEEYAKTWIWRWKKYKKIVDAWIQFHKDTSIITLASEHYIRTSQYQGTIDRIAEYNWEVWIIDWKTWSLAKDKFWLKNTYKKSYDKIKKTRLQLSLYAYAMWIKKIWVVELRNEWYYFYPLELIPLEEIEEILKQFKER